MYMQIYHRRGKVENIWRKIRGEQRKVNIYGCMWDYYYCDQLLIKLYADKPKVKNGEYEYFPIWPHVRIAMGDSGPFANGAIFAIVVLPKNREDVMSDFELQDKYNIPILYYDGGGAGAMIKLDLDDDFSESEFFGEIVRAKYVIADLYHRPIDPATMYTQW